MGTRGEVHDDFATLDSRAQKKGRKRWSHSSKICAGSRRLVRSGRREGLSAALPFRFLTASVARQVCRAQWHAPYDAPIASDTPPAGSDEGKRVRERFSEIKDRAIGARSSAGRTGSRQYAVADCSDCSDAACTGALATASEPATCLSAVGGPGRGEARTGERGWFHRCCSPPPSTLRASRAS